MDFVKIIKRCLDSPLIVNMTFRVNYIGKINIWFSEKEHSVKKWESLCITLLSHLYFTHDVALVRKKEARLWEEKYCRN